MALNEVYEKKTIIKSSLSFFTGTLLSRVTGFLRDISMAYFFGADASIAAFLVALRLATLLRHIFGEGALLNGFIPHFEAHRNLSSRDAAEFFRDTFFTVALILIALIVGGEIFLYFLAPFIHAEQILHLTMIIFPGVLFVCLFGLCSGLLHCEKHFFITGSAPIAYNAIWIFAVWAYGGKSSNNAAVVLSSAISIAFFFQWIITAPITFGFLRRNLSWKEIFSFRFFPIELRQMFSALSLGVVGVAATQINTAIDAVFSRYASLEGPAYLNYAIHLQQLPLALFGIGIATVLLPSLSRTVEGNEKLKLVEFALKKSLFILIPCTAAIFVGGASSVNLIYGRGQFGAEALLNTTQCLWGYGFGLIPMALTLLVSPIFYVLKDYKTPMLCSLTSIGVNLALNTLFVVVLKWGPSSLALSTSLAATVNACLLFRKIHEKGYKFSSELKSSIGSTSVCALFSALITGWTLHTFTRDPTFSVLQSLTRHWESHFPYQLQNFLIFFCSYVVFFFLAALFFKKKEIFAFLASKR